MSELDPAQRRLAEAYGVATDYHDWQGRPTVISPETITGVLAALGVNAATPEAAATALAEHELAPWLQVLPPCLVARAGEELALDLHLVDAETDDDGSAADLRLDLEDGSERSVGYSTVPVAVRQLDDGRSVARFAVHLPADLPLGYHRLTAARNGAEPATCTVIVTPTWVGMPEQTGERRLWGLATQLYSVRSRDSWSIGDLADLATLCRWSGGDHDAGYILINPLHAAEPVPPMEPSPYLPTTRRFVNPIYLRVEDIAETDRLGAAEQARLAELREEVRRRPESWQRIDRDAAWAAKREALELIFAVERSPERQAEFEAFTDGQGAGLLGFATWNVIAAAHGTDWRQWPEELQRPGTEAVSTFAARHRDQIRFECWLQWVLDEQLAAAQQAALSAGMPLGVMKDLAVGVHPGGAETWSLHDVYAQGVGVGAPPDAYNQNGQNWTQMPWRPDRLAQTGYAPFRDLVATMLRNAGGVRVDHVVGLFRLWWIPEGLGPTEGTYVRYDHEAMVGILALEAKRAGAVVVGEDLGTVEPSARDYLRDRGILGTSVLWFEGDWEGDGSPLPAQRWREYCLATVTTHDLPPTAAYLAGDHVRLREELGLLTRPVAEELVVAQEERSAWLDRLRADGLLPAEPVEAAQPTGSALTGGDEGELDAELVALHRFLTTTPARLLGLALTDAIGDRRTQNQPGTTNEYPNWRVPLSDPSGAPVWLEDVLSDPRAARLMRAVQAG